MGKALYRQYRSTSFDEVLGQEHITTTLKNSLNSGSIAHAYLLTGPKGVGKTSVARILAYEVNSLPYETDGNNLDIIEIDAASNRRIDEIRSLREKVHITPTLAKYKVYIIDEVHMLTREAFNALLKTLEEPPAHVIFILATTEMHKLPETIVSRCITLTFRPIGEDALISHLKYIAKQEKLNISDEAIKLLSKHGDGSFRDSISLLDQVKNLGKKIDKGDIELVLGLASENVIENIISAISDHDPKLLDKALNAAYSHGASEINLTKQISAKLRDQLLNKTLKISAIEATQLMKNLLEVPASAKPRNKLELCLLEQLFKDADVASSSPAVVKSREDEPGLEAMVVIKPSADISKKDNIQAGKTNELLNTRSMTKAEATATIKLDEEVWNNVLQRLKSQNNTLYGIARMAQAQVLSNKLVLEFKFPFHFKQVNQPKNKSILTVILEELGHKDIELDISLNSNTPKLIKPAVKTEPEDKTLANITNIFGSGEMLDS